MHLQFFLFKPPPLSVAFLSHKQSKNFEWIDKIWIWEYN